MNFHIFSNCQVNKITKEVIQTAKYDNYNIFHIGPYSIYTSKLLMKRDGSQQGWC